MYNTSSFPIRFWSEDDRPREKCQTKGKAALTDAELLAIIIGSGSKSESAVELSKRILASVENNLHDLGQLSVKELTAFKGIGSVKAITIVAALELSRRRRETQLAQKQKIGQSKDVFQLMQPILGELEHEEFWVIYLSNANKILHKVQLSKGGITGTLVDVRIAFKLALQHGATGIVLTHNHPSGSLIPSDADKQLTKKMKIAGDQLDIKVLDHLIITQSNYFSFSDEGLL